jgi:uncharacterized damage-inducible protein DinB
MNVKVASIRDSKVKLFYSLYWPQHQIIRDFFTELKEAQYDYQMVEQPGRRSSTPRESLAHLLNVQYMYLQGAKSGRLSFEAGPLGAWKQMTRHQLLAELDRIDQEIYDFLTSDAFDSNKMIEVPWGKPMNAVDLLFFLRDHDILHVGWNLAYMDHISMPRFESLKRYWGP